MITKYNNLDINDIDMPIINENLNQEEKIRLIETLIASYMVKLQNANGQKKIIYTQIIKMLQSKLYDLQTSFQYIKK